jgi:Peptidase family S41
MRRVRWAITSLKTIAVFLILALAAGCGGSSSPAPSGPSPVLAGEAYLRELIAIMQAHSVNRKKIDWTSFQTQVLARAPKAATIPDTFDAIELALRQLDDHHSFYQLANSAARINNPTRPTGCGVANPPDPAVPADIGYVRVSQFSGLGAEGDDFASSIQAAIRARDSDSVVGWIVDLRGNSGGSMWPMIAGVGPVVGTGTLGYFVEPDGSPIPWEYRNGTAYEGGEADATVAAPYELRRPNPRVAVLTDKAVASSGEAVAVAFRGRPGTRTFGTSTCGVPTANQAYTLSDGALLFLTGALDADRNHNTYDAPLPPDEQIADPSAVVARAIAWLRSGV